MSDVGDGVVGEVDVLEVLELLEERGQDVEGFGLRGEGGTARSRRVYW